MAVGKLPVLCRRASRTRARRYSGEEFFADVLRRYREQGFADGQIKSIDSRQVGANAIFATVAWDYLGERREVLWTWTFTYNLYKTGDRWAILLQTMRD